MLAFQSETLADLATRLSGHPDQSLIPLHSHFHGRLHLHQSEITLLNSGIRMTDANEPDLGPFEYHGALRRALLDASSSLCIRRLLHSSFQLGRYQSAGTAGVRGTGRRHTRFYSIVQMPIYNL